MMDVGDFLIYGLSPQISLLDWFNDPEFNELRI